MNRGVLRKAVREAWPVTLICGGGLMAVEALFAFVLPKLAEQIEGLLAQMKVFQTIVRALLGTDMAEGMGREGIQALAWVHPVVLALVWAHAIIVCTRVPAGEVDRGTADVLFSLPVSRWSVYASEGAVWLAAAVALLLMALAGNRIGCLIAPPGFGPGPRELAIILLNLYCLGAAAAGAAFLVSALGNHRGKTMGVVVAIVLASFLLNFLSQFWEPAGKVAFLGALNYYRPIEALRTRAVPAVDVLALAGFAGTAWLAGGLVFARRDLSTV
jgi:putative exporter of polyketide antibiotics